MYNRNDIPSREITPDAKGVAMKWDRLDSRLWKSITAWQTSLGEKSIVKYIGKHREFYPTHVKRGIRGKVEIWRFVWKKKKKKSVDPGPEFLQDKWNSKWSYVTRGKRSRTLPITIIRVRKGFSILLSRFSMKFDNLLWTMWRIGDTFEYS